MFATLSRSLESISDILRESLDPDKQTGLEREQAEAWLPLVALLHGRALEAHALWQAFSERDAANAPPSARWITLSRVAGEPELEFSASPVSAAHTLAKHLWGRCHGAVVTSATLTALGRFERLQERAGLANRYRYQALPSPFDYANAVLSVPKEATDPSDKEAHEKAIVDFVTKLADREAALVLFSSRAQLRGVEKALSESVKERVLAQDALPKRELIDAIARRWIAVKAVLFSAWRVLPRASTCQGIILRMLSSPGCRLRCRMTRWEQRSPSGLRVRAVIHLCASVCQTHQSSWCRPVAG